jgi:glycosyltransferase involved in cell wall biosynthesis
LLEAMAAGRPVISTDSGGPAEYVDDGVTGFIVPVGNAEAMAAKIRVLLDDPGLRRELGRNARLRALADFSYPRMINEILNVYRDVAAA